MYKWEKRDRKKQSVKQHIHQHGKNSARIAVNQILKRAKEAEHDKPMGKRNRKNRLQKR